jgi:hypothetical protein
LHFDALLPWSETKSDPNPKLPKMATTRLRRTFAYPTECDSDDPPDLDEEHQEALLTDLQTQDEATSTLYRHLFLALPVLTSLAYVPTVFTASTATQTFAALLTIIVPALAAWVLYFYPIRSSGRHGLKSLDVGSGRSEASGEVKPREQYLIISGATLAGMLVLQSLGTWWAGEGEESWGVVVPAGEFASILIVMTGIVSDIFNCSCILPYPLRSAAARAGGS